MKSNANIEKMETTPFSRQIDSVISLSFDRDTDLKPHIFACYNNEVSSSLYLHNKIITLNLSQNCDSKHGSSSINIDEIIEKLTSDMNVNLEKYLPKNTFYDYVNRPTSDPFKYIRYIDSINMLYTEKAFASAQGFVMYSTGEHTPSNTPGSGTLEHNLLLNRDLADQHPLSAITGLTEALESKALASHTHNYLSTITKNMVEQVLTGDIISHSHSKYALLNGSETEDFKTKILTVSGVGYFKSGLVMFGTEGGSSSSGGLDIVEIKRYLTTNPEDWKLALSYLPPNVIIDGDYRLTNARSASDVYAWAKAASKPSYNIKEIGDNVNLYSYLGKLPGGANQVSYDYHGGWNEDIEDASIGYFNLFSAGSASSILLKHNHDNNTIYFKKSIDSNRWLSDWNFFWTSANIQFTNEPIPNYGVKYDKYGYVNAIIFHDTYMREDAIPINSIYVRNGSDTFLRNTSTANFISKLGLWTNTNFTPHFKIDGGSYDNYLNWNDGFSNRGFMGSVFSGTNRPTGAEWNFLIQAVHRNGEADGANNVFQLACGLSSYRNVLCFRGSKTESWNTIWSTANLNRPIYTDDSKGLNNITNVSNRIWFDYNFAGRGVAGSVISYSGLSGGYEVDIIGAYQNSKLYFRTRNGDTGNYNPIYQIYNSGSTDIIAIDNGSGNIGITTGSAALNHSYPTIATTGKTMYFMISNIYSLAVTNENGATVLHKGNNNRFKMTGNVTTEGTVVMFSTN